MIAFRQALARDNPLHGRHLLGQNATDQQRDEIRRLLHNDYIKKNTEYELSWRDAYNAVAKCALKSAKSSLTHLRNSRYNEFRELQIPELLADGTRFPIPHIAFISVKVTKALQRIITSNGMNHGHSADWATEALLLDDNYRSSRETGFGRFVLFNRNNAYDNLSASERSRILARKNFQGVPEQ